MRGDVDRIGIGKHCRAYHFGWCFWRFRASALPLNPLCGGGPRNRHRLSFRRDLSLSTFHSSCKAIERRIAKMFTLTLVRFLEYYRTRPPGGAAFIQMFDFEIFAAVAGSSKFFRSWIRLSSIQLCRLHAWAIAKRCSWR